MATVLIIIHLMVVLALVIVVLLQRSEGGALGIGGGGGGAMSARGSADAMTRTTGILAATFFVTSIALGVLAQNNNRTDAILDGVPGTAVPSQNGVPTTGGDIGGSGGGILDDLQRQSTPAAPATGVPATE